MIILEKRVHFPRERVSFRIKRLNWRKSKDFPQGQRKRRVCIKRVSVKRGSTVVRLRNRYRKGWGKEIEGFSVSVCVFSLRLSSPTVFAPAKQAFLVV